MSKVGPERASGAVDTKAGLVYLCTYNVWGLPKWDFDYLTLAWVQGVLELKITP